MMSQGSITMRSVWEYYNERSKRSLTIRSERSIAMRSERSFTMRIEWGITMRSERKYYNEE